MPPKNYSMNFSGPSKARQGEGRGTTPQAFFERAKLGPQKTVTPDVSQALQALPRSLKDSYNSILKAQRLFNQVPARVRELFKNDPVNLIEGLARFKDLKPEVQDILIKAGLAKAPVKDPGPAKVVIVDPDTGKPPKADSTGSR